jgi:hypothetical protein
MGQSEHQPPYCVLMQTNSLSKLSNPTQILSRLSIPSRFAAHQRVTGIQATNDVDLRTLIQAAYNE